VLNLAQINAISFLTQYRDLLETQLFWKIKLRHLSNDSNLEALVNFQPDIRKNEREMPISILI